MPFSSSATRPFPALHLDFESGDLSGWSCKRLFGAHSAVVQSDVVRVGKYACRFELRPGDYISQGHRAELRDHYNVRWDERVWYGFSTFLSAEHRPSAGVGLVLAQWHDQAKLGDPSGKPPIAIRYRDGRLFVTGAAGKFASPAPDSRYEFLSLPDFPLGRWHDFVFEVFWSRHGTSEIRAWLNGELVIDWRGPLAYENEVEGPYFKLGVYCSPPDVVPVVAYHDNYSRGHSYAEVDPSVLHTKSELMQPLRAVPPRRDGRGTMRSMVEGASSAAAVTRRLHRLRGPPPPHRGGGTRPGARPRDRAAC